MQPDPHWGDFGQLLSFRRALMISYESPFDFLVFPLIGAGILFQAALLSRPSSSDPIRWRSLAEILCSRRGRIGLLTYASFSLAVIFFGNYDGGVGGGDDDVYQSTPFCSPDGSCGELADVPSPRTKYSSFTKEQFGTWMDFHAKLNASAVEYASRIDSGKEVRPLILLGDSITECYLGSSYGVPRERCKDVPSILETEYRRYNPLVLAISGDQTQHLLWRLMNGGLLPEYATRSDAIYVVLIGTNNIGSGHSPRDAAGGVVAVVEHLAENTKGRIILLEILPRGDSYRTSLICPPRCGEDGKPLKSFLPAVVEANAELRERVSTSKILKGNGGRRVSLVDCGGAFAPEESAKGRGDEVNADLMPDSLHPNADGHRALAKCALSCIDRIDGKC